MDFLGGLTLPLPEAWLVRRETAVVLLAAGLVLLLFGRRLFWLFVALIGALAALWLSTEVLGLQSGVPSLLAAVAAGLVGGLLAVLLQKAAVGLVGFLAGAWGILVLLKVASVALASSSVDLSPLASPLVQGALALVGGVLGSILMIQLFEAALVVLTAVTGALLLVQGLGLGGALALGVFVTLSVVGVLSQTRRPRAERRAERRERQRDSA